MDTWIVRMELVSDTHFCDTIVKERVELSLRRFKQTSCLMQAQKRFLCCEGYAPWVVLELSQWQRHASLHVDESPC